MGDLWSDLEAESRKPGPTMTITKAQYAALLAAATPASPETPRDLLREIGALKPLQMPLGQGGSTVVGWALPEWLKLRLITFLAASPPDTGAAMCSRESSGDGEVRAASAAVGSTPQTESRPDPLAQRRARDEAIAAVARWIGKSGFARHIADNKRAWDFCLREAEGLLFDEYGGVSDATVAIDLYLNPEAEARSSHSDVSAGPFVARVIEGSVGPMWEVVEGDDTEATCIAGEPEAKRIAAALNSHSDASADLRAEIDLAINLMLDLRHTAALTVLQRVRAALATPSARAEREGLDVERLARALEQTEVGCWATGARHSYAQDEAQHRRDAAAIAAEYARLAPTSPSSEETT